MTSVGQATGAALRISDSPPAGEGPYRPDFVVEATSSGKPYRFIIVAKRLLFPRDAREAMWQLRNYLAHDVGAGQAVPVLMAETISPGARELLRDERIGFFDASGSLFIAGDGLYVLVDKPQPRKQTRSLANLFAGRRAQALHAVWLFRNDWFNVHKIAERAGVSSATASETLIAIERRDWVETRGAGPAKERRLTNPHALLDAWSAHQASVKPKTVRQYYVRSAAVADLQRRIDRACQLEGVQYEFTGVCAAQIHAPYLSSVSQVSCRMPAGRGMHAVLNAVDARPVSEGWNLSVDEARSDSELRFRERIDDLWFADSLQTYLDLLHAGGRAKEFAKHLRAERLVA